MNFPEKGKFIDPAHAVISINVSVLQCYTNVCDENK